MPKKKISKKVPRFAKGDNIMAIRIEHYGSDEDFTLLGHTFHGIKDLKDYIEISVYETSSPFPLSELDKKTPKKAGNIHVGDLWHPYPTFDDDYAESRYFRNFIVRNCPITEDNMKVLYDLPRLDNYKRITNKIQEDMLPIVYYDNERDVIIATKV